MSRSRAANCRSVESLKERTRWGCNLCARQMRCTEETLIPVTSAIAAAVQWVAGCGGSLAVSAITRSMIACSNGGIRDGRVLSRRSPSTPSVMNRSCQRQTLGFALPPAHDLRRAETVRGREDDLRSPDVLLRAVPVRNNRFQTDTVGGAHFDADVLAHTPDSHKTRAMGILCQTHSTRRSPRSWVDRHLLRS